MIGKYDLKYFQWCPKWRRQEGSPINGFQVSCCHFQEASRVAEEGEQVEIAILIWQEARQVAHVAASGWKFEMSVLRCIECPLTSLLTTITSAVLIILFLKELPLMWSQSVVLVILLPSLCLYS